MDWGSVPVVVFYLGPQHVWQTTSSPVKVKCAVAFVVMWQMICGQSSRTRHVYW